MNEAHAFTVGAGSGNIVDVLGSPLTCLEPQVEEIRIEGITPGVDDFFHVFQSLWIVCLAAVEKNDLGAQDAGGIGTDAALLGLGAGGKGLDVLIRQVFHHECEDFIPCTLVHGIHFFGRQDALDERNLFVAHPQVIIEQGAEEFRLGHERLYERVVQGAFLEFVDQGVCGNFERSCKVGAIFA